MSEKEMIDLERRQFIKSVGWLAGSALAAYPLFSFASGLTVLTGAHAHADTLNQFIALSQILTASDALPSSRATTFLAIIDKSDLHDKLTTLLQKIEAGKQRGLQVSAVIKTAIAQSQRSHELVREIINMWLCGSFRSKTISAEAYTNSLVWSMFYTTPPGVAMRPGTDWSEKPEV